MLHRWKHFDEVYELSRCMRWLEDVVDAQLVSEKMRDEAREWSGKRQGCGANVCGGGRSS